MLCTKQVREKEAMQREGFTNWAQKLHKIGMIANAVRFTIDCKTYCLKKETPQLRLQLSGFEQKFNALLKSCLLCLRKIQNLNRNIATVGDYVQFSWDVSKIPYTEQYFYVFSIHTEILISIICGYIQW